MLALFFTPTYDGRLYTNKQIENSSNLKAADNNAVCCDDTVNSTRLIYSVSFPIEHIIWRDVTLKTFI